MQRDSWQSSASTVIVTSWVLVLSNALRRRRSSSAFRFGLTLRKSGRSFVSIARS